MPSVRIQQAEAEADRMNWKHPTDVMRTRMLHGRVDCEQCKHWIPQGQVPWCNQHKHNNDAPGYTSSGSFNTFCLDFEMKK